MKMYVTMKDQVHDEEYEFGRATLVDAVFSSKKKALDRIKSLAEKESKELTPEDFDEEDYMNEPIEGYMESPREDTYRVWEGPEDYVDFYIKEAEFNPSDERDSKHIVAYNDNPNDLDYAYWH